MQGRILNLYYNGDDSYLLSNGKKSISLKQIKMCMIYMI